MRRTSVLQHLHTVVALGWSDFVLKYRGSILGYLWSLISPLVKFTVILVVFGPYVSPSIPQYPLYLFLGLIIWEHFAMTTNGCMTMLLEKGQIIRHLAFPRILLILATGWTNLIVFVTHVVIFLVFAWTRGAALTPGTFLLVLTALEMSLLALGVGMMLASFALTFRDLPHLWNVMTQVLFWLTPILYPSKRVGTVVASILSVFHGSVIHILRQSLALLTEIQPLSLIIHDARRFTLYPGTAGVPSIEHLTGVTLVCGIIFLMGLRIYHRRSRYFVEQY